jgi:hypothetical protein
VSRVRWSCMRRRTPGSDANDCVAVSDRGKRFVDRGRPACWISCITQPMPGRPNAKHRSAAAPSEARLAAHHPSQQRLRRRLAF